MRSQPRSHSSPAVCNAWFALPALLCGGLAGLLDPVASGAAVPETLPALLGQAYRHQKHGWIFLHVEGSPRACGFQHGYLLSREITESLRVTRALWEHGSAVEWAWLVAKAGTLIEPGVDARNLAEVDGLVEGLQAAGVATSRAEMLTYNAWFELDWYWWPMEKKKMGSEAPQPVRQSCSAFIATGRQTADGNVVLGHNSMVDYPEAAANIILDIRPDQGHRILMQAWPGWIHSGTDFFVTDAGLVGAETTLGSFERYAEHGIPEFARMRRATQDAGSIAEWCEIMKRGNNGGYANAWLLGDVRSGEIARLELGLKCTALETKRDGFFLGSNLAEDLKLLRFETDANDSDIRLSSVARRVRWKRLMAEHAGRIDLKRARAFEADHYDSFHRKVNPGSRTLCGHYELEGQFWGGWPAGPFAPAGTFDAKVVDAGMARAMSFEARWGSACGRSFDARKFLAAHPQFDWMSDLLKSRPAQPWTVFKAGERKP
jgi:hypothetical protein